VAAGEALVLTFKGDQKLDVIAGEGGTSPVPKPVPKAMTLKPKPPSSDQGSLF
jgi:exodeoxyribonuclease VII large subunit